MFNNASRNRTPFILVLLCFVLVFAVSCDENWITGSSSSGSVNELPSNGDNPKDKGNSGHDEIDLPLLNNVNEVLLIGNSHTHYNGGIDTYITALLNEIHPDTDYHIERCTEGGIGLIQHMVRDSTIDAINSRDWDVIVLQDHSIFTIEHYTWFVVGVRNMDAMVDSVGARSMLFMTWGKEWRPGMIDTVSVCYELMGKKVGAWVSPVGLVWAKVLEERPDIELYDPDGSHASMGGTWLATCVLFSSIFDESPQGHAVMDANVVPVEHQLYLAETAWTSVQEYNRRVHAPDRVTKGKQPVPQPPDDFQPFELPVSGN